MPLTNKQRQAALRTKRAALGQKEMRGIWVTDKEESTLKPALREQIKSMRANVKK